MDTKEQKQYLKVLEDLKGAIARDYPEHAPNIYIIDPSKPLAEEMARAAEHLQIPNLQERYERVLPHAGPFKGAAFGFRRGDTDNTDPIDDRSGQDVWIDLNNLPRGRNDTILVFPMASGEDMSYRGLEDSLFTVFHEVGHAIHLLDPNYFSTFPQTDGQVHGWMMHQRLETFAETFGYDLGVSSGAISDVKLVAMMAERDKEISNAQGMNYNANEEYALLRQNHPLQRPKTYEGIPNLREIYERSMKAQDANLDLPTLHALRSFNEALPPAFSTWMGVNQDYLADSPMEQASLHRLIDAMPYSERVMHAVGPLPKKNYSSPDMKQPDLIQTTAKVWLANTQPDNSEAMDFIEDADARYLLQNALKQYNAANGQTPIDINALQPVIQHTENKVWAEELLRGTPIIEALQRGLASIETDQPVPDMQPASSKGLQR